MNLYSLDLKQFIVFSVWRQVLADTLYHYVYPENGFRKGAICEIPHFYILEYQIMDWLTVISVL
jgi:hypothetical protein